MRTRGGLYYEDRGAGAPLVLLHGHTLDHRMWDEFIPTLSQRFRVLSVDLPGHGQSEPLRPGTTWSDHLAALLDEAGAPRAAVCGLSIGAAGAVSFALHHPSRVSALVTVDAALFGHAFPTWPGARPYARMARTEGLAPALEAWLADPLFAPALASPAADRLRRIVREYPGTEWLQRQPPAFPPGPPEPERLGEIASPTLVIVGELDLPDFQEIADLLAQRIPGARKAVMAGAGHIAPMEQPEQFLSLLLPFLDEHLRK